jgi:hypothetical protein
MPQKATVFDSEGRLVGTVANLYADDDSRQLRFIDVVTSGFLELGKKHYLGPFETVTTWCRAQSH